MKKQKDTLTVEETIAILCKAIGNINNRITNIEEFIDIIIDEIKQILNKEQGIVHGQLQKQCCGGNKRKPKTNRRKASRNSKDNS